MMNSLWDSFRSQIPFLTIFDPSSVTKMIRSLIDTQRHLGWLPDCRMSLCKGLTSCAWKLAAIANALRLQVLPRVDLMLITSLWMPT